MNKALRVQVNPDSIVLWFKDDKSINLPKYYMSILDIAKFTGEGEEAYLDLGAYQHHKSISKEELAKEIIEYIEMRMKEHRETLFLES